VLARLGSYEILAPIGADGMGEVYKARDANLGREVTMVGGNLPLDPGAAKVVQRLHGRLL
jgi:serine/threonine protein kinase